MMTTNDFLGGKIHLKQFEKGLRATSDAVLCAAAVPLKKGDTLLDVGAGNGVIGLCAYARTPCQIHAIEKQPDLIQLIQDNALLNHIPLTVHPMDIFKEDPLKGQQFHQVVSNPPFYDTTGKARTNPQQKIAYHADFDLEKWLNFCLKHLRAKGTFTFIHQPSQLGLILNTIEKKLGRIEIIPILPKKDSPALRVIIRGKMGDKTPLKILPPFIMHQANNRPTPQANAVLRRGHPL